MPQSESQDKSESSDADRILKVTVGNPPNPLNAPIALVEYDPKWPMVFSSEAQRIAKAVGDRALRIEHVGSTAVPNLVAKPIIDILLIVESSANEALYVPALEGLGYVLRVREPEWHEHRMLRAQRDVTINLHVFTKDDDEAERMLAFRDWLRNNPQDRDLYAETKRKLASQNWKYVQNYADAKSKVVESIIKRAQQAREKTLTQNR
jgi:GrpB-like predicted nucleotidyltransferase (UPF0157 family)